MRPKTALPVSHSEAPGPGTYTLDSLVGRSAPAASMSGRFHLSQDSFQPGPGAYNLQQVGEIGKDAPHISMAQRPKASSQQAGTPGPGQYTVHLPSDTPAITMQGRHEEKVEQSGVGPGHYTIPSTLAVQSPAYSMTGRHEEKLSVQAPGPGAYTLPSSLGLTPAASLSGRHELKEDHSQPGPGTYQASVGQTKQGQPDTRAHTLTPAHCALRTACASPRHLPSVPSPLPPPLSCPSPVCLQLPPRTRCALRRRCPCRIVRLLAPVLTRWTRWWAVQPPRPPCRAASTCHKTLSSLALALTTSSRWGRLARTRLTSRWRRGRRRRHSRPAPLARASTPSTCPPTPPPSLCRADTRRRWSRVVWVRATTPSPLPSPCRAPPTR